MRSLDRLDDIAGCCALAFPPFSLAVWKLYRRVNAEELGVKKLMVIVAFWSYSAVRIALGL